MKRFYTHTVTFPRLVISYKPLAQEWPFFLMFAIIASLQQRHFLNVVWAIGGRDGHCFYCHQLVPELLPTRWVDLMLLGLSADLV